MKPGAMLIADERLRQITKEGWTASHDDSHGDSDFIHAAISYLQFTVGFGLPSKYPFLWPWSIAWWKPKDRRRNLVRAGALIAAELDRMNRKELKAKRKKVKNATP